MERFNSKEEAMKYINSLPEEHRQGILDAVDTVDARQELAMMINAGLGIIGKRYPAITKSNIYNLLATLSVTACSNVDELIIDSLHETNTLEIIIEILKKLSKSLKDEEGESLNSILKNFKLSDN